MHPDLFLNDKKVIEANNDKHLWLYMSWSFHINDRNTG